MNKMILTAAVIAAAALTVSCEQNTENTGLSVDAESISYPLSGGTFDINLTSGKPWKALYCTEWLTVTPESGEGDATVTVGVEAWANEDSEEARLAGVHLTDNTDTILVLINQVNDDNFGIPSVDHVSRPSAYLRLSSNNIQCPAQGGFRNGKIPAMRKNVPQPSTCVITSPQCTISGLNLSSWNSITTTPVFRNHPHLLLYLPT